MFITAALFTIARTWKQPKCPLTDEWIKKKWYMEYYSAIKRNEIESFVVMWMDLESVIRSEVSEREKQILHINAYVWNLEKWYWWSYFQGRNRDINVEMWTKREKERVERIGKTALTYIHSVQFSLSVVSDSLRPHELQHARPHCPSPTPCVK